MKKYRQKTLKVFSTSGRFFDHYARGNVKPYGSLWKVKIRIYEFELARVVKYTCENQNCEKTDLTQKQIQQTTDFFNLMDGGDLY